MRKDTGDKNANLYHMPKNLSVLCLQQEMWHKRYGSADMAGCNWQCNSSNSSIKSQHIESCKHKS